MGANPSHMRVVFSSDNSNKSLRRSLEYCRAQGFTISHDGETFYVYNDGKRYNFKTYFTKDQKYETSLIRS